MRERLRRLGSQRALPAWLLFIWKALATASTIEYMEKKMYAFWSVAQSPAGGLAIIGVAVAWLTFLVVWPRKADSTSQRAPEAGKESQVEAAVVPPPDPPQLLINYTSEGNGKYTFINEGPGSIVNLSLDPLRWSEKRELGFFGTVGTIRDHSQSEHKAWFIESPNSGGELCSFMRRHTEADADTTVEASYEDASGRKYRRTFTLISGTDGKVTWKPGPVQCIEAEAEKRAASAS